MRALIVFIGLIATPVFGASLDSNAIQKVGFLKQYYNSIVGRSSASHKMSVFRINDLDCDHRPTCTETACDQGGYDCHFAENLDHVINACKGTDGECVVQACKAGGYDCRFAANLDHVLALCHESRGSCVGAVCSQGGYDCHFSGNLDHVLDACRDTDGRCVRDTCAQGAYDCRFSSNLDQVIQFCKKYELADKPVDN